MDIDFTVGLSGSITVKPDGLLRVPQGKILRNFNMVINEGFFFIDGKVVNEKFHTFENRMGALLGIMGNGPNDGVFINDGTVNDSGTVESEQAKWTNTGTYNKNRGTFDMNLSDFINMQKGTQKGTLNIIGGGTMATSATFTALDSDIVNTQESIINIGSEGSLLLGGNSVLKNKLLSKINVNDGGLFDIFTSAFVQGVINESKLNVNAGGLLSISGVVTEITNTGSGVITNQGATDNPARIEIMGSLVNDRADINNESGGIIEIFTTGILENISPGSLTNNIGAEIIINGDPMVVVGRIFGDGKVTNNPDDSIVNFGLIDISGPWENFGTIVNEGIINVLCGGSIDPLGTIIGAGEFNEFECPIGGTFVPIDTTILLLVSVQSISMWLIPVVAAGIVIGIFVIKRRK